MRPASSTRPNASGDRPPVEKAHPGLPPKSVAMTTLLVPSRSASRSSRPDSRSRPSARIVRFKPIVNPARSRSGLFFTTYQRVAVRAYYLWQSEGCPEGRDEAHWFQAEAELKRLSVTASK